MTQRAITTAEVINRGLDRRLLSLRTSFPGIVLKYDAATQLADIQPCPIDRIENEDGTESAFRPPVIPNVPVSHPYGGGMFVHVPLAVGDEVWIVCTDRALDTWLDRGGEYTPEDMRSHSLKDAWAYPGAHSLKTPLQGVDANVITIGSNAGTSQFVALANKVQAALEVIKTAANSNPAIYSAFATALAAVDTDVASATVKIKG